MKKLITSGIISLALASALMAVEGDIVFVIDESGSMGNEIQTVKDNVGNLIDELNNQGVDYQLGLVGFGGYEYYISNPRVITKLTDSEADFRDGLDQLMTYPGGHEPGSDATTLGLSSDMEAPNYFREDAGTCVILLTDEDDDSANTASALTALSAKSAIFYGIVQEGFGNTAATYGPDVGSLSETTGGSIWSIQDLVNDPATGEAILLEVMEKCISEAIKAEVNFDIHPTSCPNPLNKKSKGVTPMAILGTADFDVMDVNVSSLAINGVSPVNHAYEDVAMPYEGEFSDPADKYECNEEGPDGYMDLTLKFDTQAILDSVDKGEQYMEITGTKLSDGSPVNGKDVIWVK